MRLRAVTADSTVSRAGSYGANARDTSCSYVRIVYTEGEPERADRIVPVERGHSLVVGRAPTRELRSIELPSDKHASRAHMRLSAYEVDGARRVLVEDLRSRNRTFVNGTPIDRRVCETGDVIRVGGSLLVVGDAPASDLQAPDSSYPGIVVRSWGMRQVFAKLQKVARSKSGVLLLGETGVGKTMLAHHIHRLSARAERPFVRHNCSAIPTHLEEATLFGVVDGFVPEVKARRGLLQRAKGGTLFLDELADLAPRAQSMLLDAFDPTDASFLQVGGTERCQTDCRLVAATNRDLFSLAERGVVRADLLSRLVVVQVEVPPLRERREAIMALFRGAMRRLGASEEAPRHVETAEAMLIAPWTENVRGLESLAQRVAVGESLTVALIEAHAGRGEGQREPNTHAPTSPPPAVSWPPDRATLLRTLDAHAWCVADAAETLGKRRETLARLIRRYFGPGGKQRAFEAFQELERES